jgi:hypothetical protein
MFDRFERPVKIVCLALAAWLAWQLGSLILNRDPLANLKIPAVPTLPDATNEPAKSDRKETNVVSANIGTNATNATVGTNVVGGTNLVKGTNTVSGTNALPATNEMAKSTNAPGPKHDGSQKAGPHGMTPEMMAQMAGGGMPGGRRGGGLKKMELPPEVQTRVDKIVDSEIFGPVIHPMPMALIGIADQEAFIQATNGQTDAVKVGGELAGIKLLRIGVNRVLVESDGEKKELTLFDGIGGESLLPKSTNEPSTNAPSTNAPAKKASKRKALANNASTNQPLSSQQKEIP